MKYGLGAVPGFSVIMPTYQRRARLEPVLRRLDRQVYPRERLEIIVVSDGSTDGTADMARRLRLRFPLRVFEQANQGPAVARNLGLQHAHGPFVIFLDDDVMPDPYFVAEHAYAHAEHMDRVVIGPLLPPPTRARAWVEWEGEKLVEQYEYMRRGWFEPTPYQFYTGNASVSLDAVRRVGGFDRRYLRAEDVELALRLQRAGMQFHFAPRAGALHVADRSYSAWLRAAYQYGHNDVALTAGQTSHSLKRVSQNITRRHPALQAAVRLGLKYPGLRPIVGAAARIVASSAPSVGPRRIAHWACSIAFNFEYWQGVSDALGDRSTALALFERPRVA